MSKFLNICPRDDKGVANFDKLVKIYFVHFMLNSQEILFYKCFLYEFIQLFLSIKYACICLIIRKQREVSEEGIAQGTSSHI